MEVALPTTMGEAILPTMAEATLPTTMAEATPHIIPPVDITGDPTTITIRTHQIITDRIGVLGNIASPTQAIWTLMAAIIEPAVIMWLPIILPQGKATILAGTGWILTVSTRTAEEDTPEVGAVMANIMTSC